MKKIDTSEWKKYQLCDLFEITGSKTTPKNALTLSETQTIEQPYPYITTAGTNNGILGYSEEYTEEGKVITIDSAVLGTAFYQADNFTASDHVEKLIPKFAINKYIGSFVASVLNKTKELYGYAYNNKRSQVALHNEIIYLPSGTPPQLFRIGFDSFRRWRYE